MKQLVSYYKMQSTLLSKFLFVVAVTVCSADYWEDRAKLIERDQNQAQGASIVLSEKERVANMIFMNHKLKELDEGFVKPGEFLAGQHFFKAKPIIEESEVFKIIQILPKGASLHSHDTAMASQEYVFNLTFEDNLYGCVVEGRLIFNFFNPNDISKDCDWKSLKELRETSPNFDNFLNSQISLIRDDPKKEYPDIDAVWKTFGGMFQTVNKLISYKPIWGRYVYEALKELYEDNVMYLEFRSILPELYDLEGNSYNYIDTVGIYYEALQEFKRDYPDFIGARLIYAPSRNIGNETMKEFANNYRKLKELYPDFIAGFDLVGQEDKGRPLIEFMNELLALKEEGTTFFCHAGETNWQGTTTDINLFDAVLLGTKRIGHGYAITKHPTILEAIKQQKIAVEISPISNQVLKLVEDIRNHPGAILLSTGSPVVIVADDPGFWGAKGLSYDWYYAFMGMAGRDADLRFLKQLAINSIEYAVMDASEKARAFEKWEKDWDRFLDKVISGF